MLILILAEVFDIGCLTIKPNCWINVELFSIERLSSSWGNENLAFNCKRTSLKRLKINSGIPWIVKQRFSLFFNGHTKCGSAPPLGPLLENEGLPIRLVSR